LAVLTAIQVLLGEAFFPDGWQQTRDYQQRHFHRLAG
jgi:hypothetical protein